MKRATGRAAASFLLFLVLVLGCSSQTPLPTSSATPPGSVSPAPTQSAPVPGSASPAPSASTPAPAIWEVTAVAPMLRSRDGFRVSVLGDDTILVVGDDEACHPGGASPGSETSERYDAVANEWSIAASLNNPRKDFAMVPAPNGGVMVIGGVNAADQPFSSTKRFDLDMGFWVDGPLLNRAYGDPSAVTVEDGRIYVLGPTIPDETNTTSTVEILAPGRNGWDDGGRLEGVTVRDVVGLNDRRVAALGTIFESPDAVLVHHSGGAEGGWKGLALTGFDLVERIVAIRGGGLLAFGSMHDPATGEASPLPARRHDPATDRWVETGPMSAPRSEALITTLADGRVLVAGGVVGPPRDASQSEIVKSSEIYDPRTDAWIAGPNLLEIRADGQAVTLNDGSVLVMGGLNTRNVAGDTPFCTERLTSVERLTPAP